MLKKALLFLILICTLFLGYAAILLSIPSGSFHTETKLHQNNGVIPAFTFLTDEDNLEEIDKILTNGDAYPWAIHGYLSSKFNQKLSLIQIPDLKDSVFDSLYITHKRLNI